MSRPLPTVVRMNGPIKWAGIQLCNSSTVWYCLGVLQDALQMAVSPPTSKVIVKTRCDSIYEVDRLATCMVWQSHCEVTKSTWVMIQWGHRAAIWQMISYILLQLPFVETQYNRLQCCSSSHIMASLLGNPSRNIMYESRSSYWAKSSTDIWIIFVFKLNMDKIDYWQDLLLNDSLHALHIFCVDFILFPLR